jgi:uncharacterized membrane protein YgcG
VSCPAYLRWAAAAAALQSFYEGSGVAEGERAVGALKASGGHACGSRGSQFESLGLEYVTDSFLPEIAAKYNVPVDNLRYTANVTLKIPQMTNSAGELDGIVFEIEPTGEAATGPGVVAGSGVVAGAGARGELPKDSTYVRRVLAVIEMKRNIDDIGPAYESRLVALRWLAGLEGEADRELRKNKHYPTGRYSEPTSPSFHNHFDKKSKHTYIFATECFANFRALDMDGRLQEMLHFFARASPITCVASKDSARIQVALASSVDIDAEQDLGSPANAAGLEAIRLKISKTSRYPVVQSSSSSNNNSNNNSNSSSSSSGGGGINSGGAVPALVLTSYQVLGACRLHLLSTPA